MTSGAWYSAAYKIEGKNTEVLPNNSKAASKECPIANEKSHSQIVKISMHGDLQCRNFLRDLVNWPDIQLDGSALAFGAH